MKKESGPIKHIEELRASEEEWREIYKNSGQKSPFLSFEFIDLWYSCFAAPDEVRIYRAKKNNQTLGFLPLKLQNRHGVRYLTSITNDHCLHSEPLIIKNKDDEFQHAIMLSLFSDSSSWDVLCHDFSYSFSDLPGLVSESVLHSQCALYERRIQPTYTITLKKTFQEYFDSDLSAKIRKNLKMYRNKLIKTQVYSFMHFKGLEAKKYWRDFCEIESSGWKGVEGSAISKLNSHFQAYYERLLSLLALSGCLHLYFLRIGQQTIAGAFGYTDAKIFHYAKIGYDEMYGALSPSNLLFLHIIEDIMNNEPQVQKIHLFPWDNGYKHRFTNEKSTCIKTIIYSPTIRGRAVRSLCYVKNRICENHPGLVTHAKRVLNRLH